MAASNYLEDKVLDHVLKNTAYTQPTNLYIALFTGSSATVLANLEVGTLSNEVTGGSYARQLATFNPAASGTATIASTVTFPTATANWGTITVVAIMDAVSAGNVLFAGAVTTAKTIESADTFQIATPNLTVSLD